MILPVRLEAALSSYGSPKETRFRAVTLADLDIDRQTVIPAGSVVHGRVRKAHKVGLGLVRERAMLDLGFDEYALPDGRVVPFAAQVLTVDNGREEVTPEGEINGVLAASGYAGLIRGIWRVPSVALFGRPAGGLGGVTGITGRLWTTTCWGPAGALGLLAVRWSVVRFPEPEIRLPAGTDLILAVTAIPDEAPRFAASKTDMEVSELGTELAELPSATTKPGGKMAEDVINIAIAGSRQQVEDTFSAAGWFAAERLNRHSFSRLYKAYVSMNAYRSAPVSRLLHEGREPELVFQKTLNTVTNRHHIRLWPVEGREDLWIGAATHDVGVSLDLNIQMLTHRIDPEIDKERSKIINDLRAASCIDRVSTIARSGFQALGAVRTDGDLALIRLKECSSPVPPREDLARKPGSQVSRMARRLALETKHYVLRDNWYHYGFVGLKALHAKAHDKSHRRHEMARAPIRDKGSAPAGLRSLTSP